MYIVRVNNRLPHAHKLCRTVPASCQSTRSMATLVPRVVVNDFSPILRLFDDYSSQIATRSVFSPSLRSFNPRFDLRETSNAYELHGELPGIDHENINIEFTGPQTLSIKGRTESHREQGTKPSAATEHKVEQFAVVDSEVKAQSVADETPGSETSSYHKPTVEDEAIMSGGNEDAAESTTAESVVATPTESTVATEQAPVTTAAAPAPLAQAEDSHFWVSERSVGTFQRSFAFPGRVDQENVKASLKDGILFIVVPKAAVPRNRRVQIE